MAMKAWMISDSECWAAETAEQAHAEAGKRLDSTEERIRFLLPVDEVTEVSPKLQVGGDVGEWPKGTTVADIMPSDGHPCVLFFYE